MEAECERSEQKEREREKWACTHRSTQHTRVRTHTHTTRVQTHNTRTYLHARGLVAVIEINSEGEVVSIKVGDARRVELPLFPAVPQQNKHKTLSNTGTECCTTTLHCSQHTHTDKRARKEQRAWLAYQWLMTRSPLRGREDGGCAAMGLAVLRVLISAASTLVFGVAAAISRSRSSFQHLPSSSFTWASSSPTRPCRVVMVSVACASWLLRRSFSCASACCCLFCFLHQQNRARSMCLCLCVCVCVSPSACLSFRSLYTHRVGGGACAGGFWCHVWL